MTKTVVVLGAGQAGLPIAHYLLRSTAKKHADIRVVLVTPHDAFYWKIASVRFAIPGSIPEDKYLFPLSEKFASYPKSQFELVVGAAETLDPSTNTISVRLNGDGKTVTNGSELRNIQYHTLIIATGSRYADSMPWKEVGTTAQTKAAIASLQASIRDAKSIVVAGAGVTGVEFAGELGSAYGKSCEKEITLVGSDASLPLDSRVAKGAREAAKKELAKLNVRYVGGAKITSPASGGAVNRSGKQQGLTLTNPDGTTRTLTADLVVPTYGVHPNTEFAPASMLEVTSRRILQGADLRAKGHDNIFVVGDAGHLQPCQAAYADAQARHLMVQFEAYFSGVKDLKTYKFDPNQKQFGITLGRDRATGQMGNWVPFSILIWFFKGRYLGTNNSENYAKGLVNAMGGAWPK
ncbi:putative FAD binding protein [Xylariaceae sp. FL0255]|nr:putative FAD binding protein [Xylariaceae sp. FL0255]